MINDSELFHGNYDPAKAHEYYLRTRKLKGKKPAAPKVSNPGRPSTAVARVGQVGGKPNRADTKSRQAELRAQKERLNKRLDRLREELQKLVDAAKKRSGGDPNKKDPKDAAPETSVDKADRNKAEKDTKPLTSKQKADKAKAAKDAYEKEHPTSLSTDVEILKEQVKDIQAKIEKAMAADREREQRKTAGSNDSRSSSQTKTDGPRGR